MGGGGSGKAGWGGLEWRFGKAGWEGLEGGSGKAERRRKNEYSQNSAQNSQRKNKIFF